MIKQKIALLKMIDFISPKNFYYFAYGSNMSQSRLERRVGKVINLGHNKLSGVKLTFDTFNGCANIRNDQRFEVHGVLYKISYVQLKILDIYEGVPIFYQRVLGFTNLGKVKYSSYFYVNPNNISVNQQNNPTIQYMNYLITGAKENHLPEDYIKMLEQIPTRNG